jgi:arabinogalactan endo-1,4-beta-galactosidase
MIQEIRGKKVTELFYNPLIAYAEKYQKPVMIVEVGGPETDAEGTYRLLVNTIEALKQVPNGMGKGIFYWEPEVGAELLPDRYPLGAALKVGENTLEFTSALAAYGDCKKEVYKNY